MTTRTGTLALVFALSILAWALAGMTGVATAYLAGARGVPTCEREQVLVGSGDFSAGRWSAYACGPTLNNFFYQDIGTTERSQP